MAITLYGIAHSHPSHAARLMLEHKRLEHRLVNLLPGVHPPFLRARGFRDGAVPALVIDGRRVQGTRDIARELERLQPDPPLFPADPAARSAVEAAEAWGHDELQPVPRRVFRWALRHDGAIRRWMADEIVGLPAPGLAGAAFTPVGMLFARISGADTETVRADVERLPALLDRCDQLIAAGTIGGPERNAADCQILPSVRLLLGMEDFRAALEGRACARAALELLPDFPGPVPAALPPEWLTRASVAGAGSTR